MVTLAQEEIYTFNIISNQLATLQAEAQRVIAARNNYIGLLEGKYDATFDEKTEQFEPKKKKE